jgi:hypothetical protein
MLLQHSGARAPGGAGRGPAQARRRPGACRAAPRERPAPRASAPRPAQLVEARNGALAGAAAGGADPGAGGLVLPGTPEWRREVQEQQQHRQQPLAQAARRRPRGQQLAHGGDGSGGDGVAKRPLRISWAGSGIYFW